MHDFGLSREEIEQEARKAFSPARVTVLGIGNVILRDEGFGVRVAELLDECYEFPEDVQIVDGGTLGVELLEFVTGTKKLLVIDSINGGEEPGTMFRFHNEAIMEHFQDKLSAHEVGIQDVLAALSVTGRRIEDVIVIGAQPYDLGAGVELSEPMQGLLVPMAERAIEELKGFGVEAKRKPLAKDLDLTTVAEELWRKAER